MNAKEWKGNKNLSFLQLSLYLTRKYLLFIRPRDISSRQVNRLESLNSDVLAAASMKLLKKRLDFDSNGELISRLYVI